MTPWHPLILTLFPTPKGHEGTLTVRLPGGPLILELRRWHKVSGHVEAEVRLEIGEPGVGDPGFEALVAGLVGRVEG